MVFGASLRLFVILLCHYHIGASTIGIGGTFEVDEGNDALLTCVVTGLNPNDTVLWKKGINKILSAGVNRVTNDKRISVLHDENPGSPVLDVESIWVLLIKDTKLSDSGVYVCEVNTEPIERSFSTLLVKKNISQNEDVSFRFTNQTRSSPKSNLTQFQITGLQHDFTNCCEVFNVSSRCIGFCNVHNILDGNTGIEPEVCEKDFPKIVQCMADGRNHIPCCESKSIPDLCQDMCRGDYTPFTDYLKSRISCVRYTLPTLHCILEGVQILPSMPQDVYVDAISDHSLNITWSTPAKLSDTIKFYVVNISALITFDENIVSNQNTSFMKTFIVPSNQRSLVVDGLRSFTMYSFSVTAVNDYGYSQPSFKLRTLTLDGTKARPREIPAIPVLPDIRGCCEKKGMNHLGCLDKMCDPKKTDLTQITDLMVCAPWANITFSCLTNNIDHSPCCLSNGIPTDCLPICSGKLQMIDYNLFKCLRYISEYSSCLLQGYGVLPGPPTRLKAALVMKNFVALEWSKPKILPDTVTLYHIHYRKLGTDQEYSKLEKNYSPIILEGLSAGNYYETFVVAVNAHGKGTPSQRLVFQTKIQDNFDMVMPVYNITRCCSSSGLLPQCMPLCSYELKMSDIHSLGTTCQAQMGHIIKCAAGGRDHTACCNRRGVIKECTLLCRGVLSSNIASTDCLSYAGNILQCFEEGTGNIPAPVEDVHVTAISNTTIALGWLPPEQGDSKGNKKVDFLIQYEKVNNMTIYETAIKLENELNTSTNEIELENLQPFSFYKILVLARNEYGTSLPSSILIINTTNKNNLPNITYGVPSPPHSLAISSHSATWITIVWQPPEFSHYNDKIDYRVYHKTSSSKYAVLETRLLWARLNDLKPNSQHIIYIEAINNKRVSFPSETLVAWTDPALPAFVDPPTIHPSDIVAEGSSMTVLCLALGNPSPLISLYVGGHLISQDTSRHMVTVVHNITVDMEQVSCYADNGYGMPMQATKKIEITYPPKIRPSEIVVANVGENVDLKCVVKAKPEPKTMFWRDHEGRVPVVQGGNYDITLNRDSNDPDKYEMVLHINKLQPSDSGDYFCHAENSFGSKTAAVSARIRKIPTVHNITQCCSLQNVSFVCMSACSFYIDIDAVIDRPECISDFDKLMKCAADGSDHRPCCVASHVPRKCLNWCRGQSIGANGFCALQHTKNIIGCFQSNTDRLPGPPQNLVATSLSDHEVLIRWDPPLKNPNIVDGYRILYREIEEDSGVGNKTNSSINSHELDVLTTSVTITGLHRTILYEVVAKAGNKFGASIFTEPVRFTLGTHFMTSASQFNTTGTISGILSGILSVGLAIVAIFFYKHRKSGDKMASGVAFENPSYLREIETAQVPTTVLESTMPWRPETLERSMFNLLTSDATAQATNSINSNLNLKTKSEDSSTHYEDFALDQSDGNFKKLSS